MGSDEHTAFLLHFIFILWFVVIFLWLFPNFFFVFGFYEFMICLIVDFYKFIFLASWVCRFESLTKLGVFGHYFPEDFSCPTLPSSSRASMTEMLPFVRVPRTPKALFMSPLGLLSLCRSYCIIPAVLSGSRFFPLTSPFHRPRWVHPPNLFSLLYFHF